MKIGIVGCGLNSDYHINFSRSYPGADIVGVADRDIEKARECASRFSIKGAYGSLSELISEAGPEVVHIVTPPMSHYELVKEAIQSGCHVLVEKPMTLNAEQGESLYQLAEEKGVKLCTMHNHLFDPCMHRVDRLIKQGELGSVIGVESYYGLNTQIPAFWDYPAPNRLPWLYELPGSVYQDFLPHPLYVLFEYTGKPEKMEVMSRSNGVLPFGLHDEIRVAVEGENALGTMTFSFAARPHLHFIRVYGTKMMAEVDINTMTSVLHPVSSLPKAAQKATYNLSTAWQLSKETFSNVFKFVTKKLRPYQGMKELIHRFYDSIKDGKEPPVSRKAALEVLYAIDRITERLPKELPDFSPIAATRSGNPDKGKVLVTGATGFLGKKVVERLCEEGYSVRALSRKLSNIDDLKGLGVEIYFGDVADRDSLEEAFEGVDYVVHAAAGTSGRKKDCDEGTVQGTKNVVELSLEKEIKRLVYISSCSVYGVADYESGKLVTEDSTLEKRPSERGFYSSSKQEAEALVTDAVRSENLRAVVLRPGTIYGPGADLYTPMLGFSLGNRFFIVIGDGTFELPLAHVDNVAGAVLAAMTAEKALGRTYNIVDGETVTKRRYMDELIRGLYPGARVFYFPFGLLHLIVRVQETLFKALRKRPPLTSYRLISSQKKIRYDNSRALNELGWKPAVDFREGVRRIIELHAQGGTI